MTTTIQSQNSSCPAAIAAIAVYRRDGKPRRRFSESERIALLGHKSELDEFMRLLARRRCPYIRQRTDTNGRREWKTVPHRLRRDDVVKHLLANQIPGVAATWVGTRAWERTSYVAVDVDNRGDRQDFEARCHRVESALLVLGIPTKSLLIQQTPSGGRHYYFFLYESICTAHIRPVLELVGLTHCNGQYEIYPSEDQGLRLPFGYVPSQPHDPDAWWKFILAYKAGTFPRVNWKRCCKRAESYAQKHQTETVKNGLPSTSPTNLRSSSLRRKQPLSPLPMGLPKAARTVLQPQENMTRQLGTRPKDIDDLWQRGIQKEGTRVEATKQLAWYFIFIRGMSEEEAAEEIIEWAYRTGRHTSRDVKADIENNTRKVAEQTRSIVAWYAARRREGQRSSPGRFSAQEINALVERVAALPLPLRSARVRFAIDFLNFAKREGSRQGDGWTCCPSVRGIIRKWKNCSGTRYKAHLDWALQVGLIKMIREKWQPKIRKGRARTYAIYVPQSPASERTLSYSAAIEYACQQLSSREISSTTPFERCSGNDTYTKIVSPKERETENQAPDPEPYSMLNKEEFIYTEDIRIAPALRTVHTTSNKNPSRETGVESQHERYESNLSGPLHLDFSRAGAPPAAMPQRQYPRSPGNSLVQGASERPGIENGVQAVRHPAPGREPAVSYGLSDQTCHINATAFLDTVPRPSTNELLPDTKHGGRGDLSSAPDRKAALSLPPDHFLCLGLESRSNGWSAS
jgi:hypothetical protein